MSGVRELSRIVSGEMLPNSHLKRSFTGARNDAGLADLRFHDLRHTHGSRLDDLGFNVWKVRFDPASGKPLDQPARVTDFESPTQMIISNIVQLEMALTSDRLILPMMETLGGIWVLENVDR